MSIERILDIFAARFADRAAAGRRATASYFKQVSR